MTSSNVRDLLVPSSHNLTFPTGFKVLSKEERTAALSSLLLYDILLKCRSASSLPSSNKWPGPTPSLLTEPSCRGFHAESDGSHLKSAGLKSNIPSSSSTRISTPVPRTAGRSHLLELFLPYLPVPPIPSTTQATTRRPSLNSVPKLMPPAMPPITYRLRLSPRYMGRRQFTQPGHGAR